MVAASFSATALAKQKPCAEQIVGDWFDDGRVSKIYPLKCYSQAIASLPSRRPRLLEREGRDRSRARVREAGQAGPGRQRTQPRP